MHYYTFYESPFGKMLLLSSTEALVGLYFVGQKYYPRTDKTRQENGDIPPLRQTARELDEYFANRRVHFEVPLAPYGTTYQHAIWKAIATVPHGQTISYSELARRAGYPESPRAAGTATGQNPIGIIVPCHRIIGANGSLTGYAGGLDKKRALLALEAGYVQTSLVS
jgi:methylated-DNA-[protein]-cysteine S-methyltransferase